MAIAPEQTITPDDLLAMPDAKRYELWNGRLVEKEMGTESSWVGGRLFGILFVWNEQNRRGWVLPADASYQCFPGDPGRVRRPDVSFVRAERLPGGTLPRGHMRVAPDLVVEVVSPNDLFSEVRAKVDEYLRAGVPLIWVIDPDTRSVEAFRSGGTAALLMSEDELTGEEVLPGFGCRVGDLFPPAAESGE